MIVVDSLPMRGFSLLVNSKCFEYETLWICLLYLQVFTCYHWLIGLFIFADCTGRTVLLLLLYLYSTLADHLKM